MFINMHIYIYMYVYMMYDKIIRSTKIYLIYFSFIITFTMYSLKFYTYYYKLFPIFLSSKPNSLLLFDLNIKSTAFVRMLSLNFNDRNSFLIDEITDLIFKFLYLGFLFPIYMLLVSQVYHV